MNLFLWSAAGYLCGSLPTGYLVVKALTGKDIRTLGSGNMGGTNVGRVLGKKWAVFTTVTDMLKGGLLVLLCDFFGGGEHELALAAFFAVCGHNYPIWLKFHGGKGVATTLGTLFFVQIWQSCAAVIAGGLVWYAVMKLSRYVSVASIAALLSIAVFFFAMGMPHSFTLLAAALAALSVWRHRANLSRLKEGSENKVGTNPVK